MMKTTSTTLATLVMMATMTAAGAGCTIDGFGNNSDNRDNGGSSSGSSSSSTPRNGSSSSSTPDVDFKYSDLRTCGLFGCSLKKEVLAGSEVDISVNYLPKSADYTFRSTDESIATVAWTPRCASDNSGSSSCSETVTMSTLRAGEVALEVVDAKTNKVFATGYVHARDADRIETVVEEVAVVGGVRNARPVVNGEVTVKRGNRVDLTSRAINGAGEDLFFVRGAFGFNYDDKSIVGPLDLVIIGSSETENAFAYKTGSTKIVVLSGPTHTDVVVRVVD